MTQQHLRKTKDRPDVIIFSFELNEQIPGEERIKNLSEYETLSKIPHWRGFLSNWAITPFCIEGLTWNTVEHYLQSVKSGFIDPKMSYEFSIESRSPFSEGNGLFAKKHSLKFMSAWQQEQWINIKTFSLKNALFSKFFQNEIAKNVLLNTNSAQLWYNGHNLERQFYLEEIRELIRNDLQLINF